MLSLLKKMQMKHQHIVNITQGISTGISIVGLNLQTVGIVLITA